MATAWDIPSPEVAPKTPRSRLVGMSNPPSQLSRPSLTFSQTHTPSPSSPTIPSPPLPVRSPLRPAARSISSQSASGQARTRLNRAHSLDTPLTLDPDDFAAIAKAAIPLSFQMRDQNNFPAMEELLDALNSGSDDSFMSKSLPLRPDSPLSLSLLDDENDISYVASSTQPQPPMTKRHHALHELLSSERAYASDLALIREVHLPLALGQTVPVHNLPASPPSSSASSSRTQSTASDSSTASLGPPMTQEDAKTIFSNIAELALFSDLFCEELEAALGSVVEGGSGPDRVGELFLKLIPELERPYKYYITRHPTALTHLQNLPPTPALTAYLSYTQNVASSLSHAWDLASLLIKPVQRLLKYPLLLAAIIEETPDSHSDKENLKNARASMEEVARNVNEERRRAEVVKDVLSSKKKTVNVGVATSVNISKMKGLRHGGSKVSQLEGGNTEAAEVEKMQAELKRIEVFAQQFAKNVVDWAKMMSKVMIGLRVWAISFGKVIGLSQDQGSEAFDAFLSVVERQLMPLCAELEAAISDRLLKEIAHLLMTMNQPLKLLASMNEQEPFHYHLLTMNVSAKNRPPASLLAASTNYLALRGQLAAELPQYLNLLHAGMAIFVRRLAQIQTLFWRDVRDRWGDLWEMLRVEGELNAGHAETVNVWQARWADVDEVTSQLNINQSKKLYQEPERARPSAATVHSMLSSLEPNSPRPQRAQNNSSVNMLSTLEPSYTHVSAPYPLTPSVRTRGRGQSDASIRMEHSLRRRNSNDSVVSGKSRQGKSPRRRPDDYTDYTVPTPVSPYMNSAPYQQMISQNYQYQQHPPIPRTKSMPLHPEKAQTPSGKATPSVSSRTTNSVDGDGDYPYRSTADSYERERGRERNAPLSRSPSYKRRSSDARRQRSNSGPQAGSMTSFLNMNPDPLPDPRPLSAAQRDSWVNKRAKYVCQVIHPCKPPAAVSYFSFPFFTLVEGDLYEVLQEAGHPSIHPKLPLYVDDGEDCLLLCRDERANVGWALASFLEPLSLSN
ncbi:hypothetical protein K443DRAFT_683282 [Laccaria amethystina LaAM-08-1]|uniref:DH domain-containing protein n=1 Tax=Laccaria amethystina LaAM-08-1 TaxID=1095629 RepID=A0A0C9XBI5_9AGAR|nr:hypothetical protein K443DRAFT_683282 [Laccaria amethystina LaAM-08-1]